MNPIKADDFYVILSMISLCGGSEARQNIINAMILRKRFY